ncbi:hypothetical protein O9929_18430 [Vibrio lentus]|nr:hypothetical protein [Vibrio lentus]
MDTIDRYLDDMFNTINCNYIVLDNSVVVTEILNGIIVNNSNPCPSGVR